MRFKLIGDIKAIGYAWLCPLEVCDGQLTRFEAGGAKLLQCSRCQSIFQHLPDRNEGIYLKPALEKLELGDDAVVAAISPDSAGSRGSIPQDLARALAHIQDTLNGFGGRLTQRLAQLQARLHYLHGELAGATLAHPELGKLVETAKQAIDLVAATPDGPVAEPPRGDAG
jgi:hypothetical protein